LLKPASLLFFVDGNNITLQGQKLIDGIVATNVRIDTEINPAIEQLKDEAKRVKVDFIRVAKLDITKCDIKFARRRKT